MSLSFGCHIIFFVATTYFFLTHIILVRNVTSKGSLYFSAPDPLLGPSPGPGPRPRCSALAPPNLYLPALAPNLYLPALVPNLYLLALAYNIYYQSGALPCIYRPIATPILLLIIIFLLPQRQ